MCTERRKFPKLQDYVKEFQKGAKLAFMFEKNFAFEDDEFKTAWENYKLSQKDFKLMHCLIIGKTLSIAKLHPSIKGVKDAHTSGTSIVSFNAPTLNHTDKV